MSQENVEIVRRAFEAYARRDLDSAYAFLHPEIEFHTSSESPEAGVYRGRDARASGRDRGDRGRRERVVVVSTQYAVPKGGQQETDVHMTELWTIRDGLLAERHSYSTKAEALEAAGLEE